MVPSVEVLESDIPPHLSIAQYKASRKPVRRNAWGRFKRAMKGIFS